MLRSTSLCQRYAGPGGARGTRRLLHRQLAVIHGTRMVRPVPRNTSSPLCRRRAIEHLHGATAPDLRFGTLFQSVLRVLSLSLSLSLS